MFSRPEPSSRAAEENHAGADPRRLRRPRRQHPDDAAARHLSSDRRAGRTRTKKSTSPTCGAGRDCWSAATRASSGRIAIWPRWPRRRASRSWAHRHGRPPSSAGRAVSSRRCHGGCSTWPGVSSPGVRAKQVREEHGDPTAEVRYYGEKHQEIWLVDFDELPSLNALVLLRDPRDTFVSFHAFDAKRGERERGGFGRRSRAGGRRRRTGLARFIKRERERLRWIAGLPNGQKFPLFRYEDMVTDLPGQARRLEHWLSVSLDPEAAASDTQLRGKHVSAQTPEASVGRWRREMPAELAEQFSRELGDELEALGYDLPRSGPRQGGRRRRSSWPGTPDAIPPSPEEDKAIETTPRLPDGGAGSSGKPRHDAAKRGPAAAGAGGAAAGTGGAAAGAGETC